MWAARSLPCSLPDAGCLRAAQPKHTVQGCAAYGLHAIKHHITVTWKPVPCQGLSKAEVNQAVALAVVRAAGDARKAIRRRREGEAAPYLDHLVSALPPVASAPPTGAQSSANRGRDLPMGIAALIVWLVAAGSGAYVLGSWIARGGTLRRPAHGAGIGSPPTLLFWHFGLALSGLVFWVAYLATGWAALAWVAVAVLLPVAGLGMATLVTACPASCRTPQATAARRDSVRATPRSMRRHPASHAAGPRHPGPRRSTLTALERARARWRSGPGWPRWWGCPWRARRCHDDLGAAGRAGRRRELAGRRSQSWPYLAS